MDVSVKSISIVDDGSEWIVTTATQKARTTSYSRSQSLQFFFCLKKSDMQIITPFRHEDKENSLFNSIMELNHHSEANGTKEEHLDLILPMPASPKRPSWTRRLVITKQPASEFYKDEGETGCRLLSRLNNYFFLFFGTNRRQSQLALRRSDVGRVR